MSTFTIKPRGQIILAFTALLLASCASDTNHLQEAGSESCPDSWCTEKSAPSAIEIEQQKNEEKRREELIKNQKPIPGQYHPITSSPHFSLPR